MERAVCKEVMLANQKPFGKYDNKYIYKTSIDIILNVTETCFQKSFFKIDLKFNQPRTK